MLPMGEGKDRSITSSTSRTGTVEGEFEFKIVGYSLTKGLGIGKHLTSPTFTVGGYDWAIYFYPDGKIPGDTTYVSVFIALVSDGTYVKALFELTLVDQSGEGQHIVHSHFGRTPKDGPCLLKYRESMWGFKQFFERNPLENSVFIKDDCLIIRCRVGVVRPPTEGPHEYCVTVPESNIGQQFGELLESGYKSDITFEVRGETFAAHQLVLEARSPVLRGQLVGPMKDHNTERIVIEDIDPAVFKALLHFIYWDFLPDVDKFVGENSGLVSSAVFAQHLLVAADKYCLLRLRSICEARLCDHVDTNTAATTLTLAEQHNCVQLKSFCLKYISMPGNLKGVMQTDGYKHLEKSCPALLYEIIQSVASNSPVGIANKECLLDGYNRVQGKGGCSSKSPDFELLL